MRKFDRRPKLSVHPLDERAVPAALAAYSAGTLTIAARTGDVITVSNDADADIPGQLVITDGSRTVFESDRGPGTVNRPVHNLVIRTGGAANYSLGFGKNVVLNNLTVNGGTASTSVTLAATTRIARTFNFLGTTTGAADTVTLTPGSRVGGGVILTLRGGANNVFLDGGYVGGNVLVTSGGGADTVELAGAGDLTIGGTLGLTLGSGLNRLTGGAANTAAIGWNLIYTGGFDNDRIDFEANGTALTVAGSIDIALGDAGFETGDLNDWVSGPLFVGGDFLAAGGPGVDEIGLFGDTEINGALIADLGDFTNQLFLGYDGGGVTTIGGDLGYTGGFGFDGVYVDNTAVGGNAVLNLGAGGGESQFVQFGTRQDAGVLIDGSLSITTGAEADDVRLYATTVSTRTVVNAGGGDDWVFFDDVDLIGAVSVNLGAGNDLFEVENGADNGNETDPTLLTGIARFGDGLTVTGGAGNDTVTLRGSEGEQIRAAGPVQLIGGGGVDTLNLAATGDVYLGPTTEDFEAGDSF